ncbi:uncharacterized protein LOC135372465 [Ornithodoros turicata]|uniref:uncharacterized protein LOC135372465 n=1 Tax=Ornithodoros turicata TaxID=34597 RepID=UPI003138E6A9
MLQGAKKRTLSASSVSDDTESDPTLVELSKLKSAEEETRYWKRRYDTLADDYGRLQLCMETKLSEIHTMVTELSQMRSQASQCPTCTSAVLRRPSSPALSYMSNTYLDDNQSPHPQPNHELLDQGTTAAITSSDTLESSSSAGTSQAATGAAENLLRDVASTSNAGAPCGTTPTANKGAKDKVFKNGKQLRQRMLFV